ncbi:MAG: DNA polymerase, partial [Terracidiphilus sp.]
ELVGVRPDQIVDLMALRGDAVDNVPGAPGIGDKGSVELIQQFGTLDALLERADEVQKKSYRESLQENRERILLSRELVQIHTTAPVEFDPEAMRAREPDATAARELFGELEFNTLQREFTEAGEAMGETRYQPLTAEALADLIKAPLVALAIATPEAAVAKSDDAADEKKEEDAEPAQMTLGTTHHAAHSAASGDAKVAANEAACEATSEIALTAEASTGYTASLSGPLANQLRALLDSTTPPKAVHDVKSTAYALAASGIALGAVQHDTMLYAYLLDPTSNAQKLSDVALRRLGLKLAGGVAEAADVTLRLANTLHAEVEADADLARLYREIDLPLATVLRQMEETGVELDAAVLAEMSTRLATDIHRIEADIHRLAGTEFNVNSPKQLGDVLFNKLALPRPARGGKGKATSTAQDVLEGLSDHEIVRLVLEFRQLSKLKSTYIDSLPLLARAGRLHTSFNQAATATGRLSSTNPNLQNIPIRTELGREIRAAFVAAPGKVLVGADYSQIELRLLAHYSQDPLLLEAYRTGKDIHTLTAAEVFGVPPMLIDAEHRRRAKAVNFGIVYGLSPFGLAQQLGIEQKEAKRFIDAYFARYSGVRTFIDRTLEQARRDGYVRNLFG